MYTKPRFLGEAIVGAPVVALLYSFDEHTGSSLYCVAVSNSKEGCIRLIEAHYKRSVEDIIKNWSFVVYLGE
jgi:hypothetical protein